MTHRTQPRTEEIATRFAQDFAELVRQNRVSAGDRLKDPAWCAATSTELIEGGAEAIRTLATFYSMTLAFLALRHAPDVTPEVRTEVLGDTFKAIVKSGSTWIGTITIHTGGGEVGCLTRTDCRKGVEVELNGTLAHDYLCNDPSHRATERGV